MLANPWRSAGGGAAAYAARAAEQIYVNDQMTWLARDIGEGLPVCAFDRDSLPEPIGFLVWSEDPSAHTATLGRPRAVLWCRTGLTLRVAVLDDAGPFRRELEAAGNRADPAWARQVNQSIGTAAAEVSARSRSGSLSRSIR